MFNMVQYGRHLENLYLLTDFDEIWFVGSMKGVDDDSVLKFF